MPCLVTLVLSALNRTIGRQFWAVRVWNVLALAGTTGMLIWYLVRTQRGIAAVCGFGMLLILDHRYNG